MSKKQFDGVYWSVDEALDAMDGCSEINLDLETSGLSPLKDRIAVVAMYAPEKDVTAVLHVRGYAPPRLVDWLSKPGRTINGHNLTGFDAPFLGRYGVDVYAPDWYDTMTGELAILSSQRRDVSVSLKATTARRVGAKLNKEIDHKSWMNPTLTQEQKDYVLGDIKYLHRIKQKQLEKAAGTPQARAIRTEMRLIPAVVAMTLGGLPISRPLLDSYLSQQYATREAAAAHLRELFGDTINLRSAVQLRAALQAYGLPVTSTAYEILRNIELFGGRYGDVCGEVLRWRHGDQRIKMYTEEWWNKYVVEHADGLFRVHARFWPCGTDTGRFSSSEPNLQQVPRDMRWVFQAPPGYVIIAADYAQIEVRAAAELANDAALIDAFVRGEGDAHRSIAADIFEKAVEDVDPEERRASKAATFCLLFAGGAKTLFNYARMSGGKMDEQTAKRVVIQFFGKYRGLAALKDKAVYQAQMNRPVTINLPTGLKRMMMGASLTPMQILNTAIQGTAAAGIKLAMLECLDEGLTANPASPNWIAAQVHDELVACVRLEDADEYSEALRRCMIRGMAKVIKHCPVEVEIKRYPTRGWGPLDDGVKGSREAAPRPR